MTTLQVRDNLGDPRDLQAFDVGGGQLAIARTEVIPPSGITPVTGTSTTSFVTSAFTPILGRMVIVTITGSCSGQILRSIDGGTTKLPVTMGGTTLGPWSAPFNEPCWVETESGATLYLSLSGAGTGRIAQ